MAVAFTGCLDGFMDNGLGFPGIGIGFSGIGVRSYDKRKNKEVDRY